MMRTYFFSMWHSESILFLPDVFLMNCVLLFQSPKRPSFFHQEIETCQSLPSDLPYIQKQKGRCMPRQRCKRRRHQNESMDAAFGWIESRKLSCGDNFFLCLEPIGKCLDPLWYWGGFYPDKPPCHSVRFASKNGQTRARYAFSGMPSGFSLKMSRLAIVVAIIGLVILQPTGFGFDELPGGQIRVLSLLLC